MSLDRSVTARTLTGSTLCVLRCATTGRRRFHCLFQPAATNGCASQRKRCGFTDRPARDRHAQPATCDFEFAGGGLSVEPTEEASRAPSGSREITGRPLGTNQLRLELLRERAIRAACSRGLEAADVSRGLECEYQRSFANCGSPHKKANSPGDTSLRIFSKISPAKNYDHQMAPGGRDGKANLCPNARRLTTTAHFSPSGVSRSNL
jgi:hypothetical protein